MCILSYTGCKRAVSCWPISARLTKHVKRVSTFLGGLFSCYSCQPNYDPNIKRAVSTHLFYVVFKSSERVVSEIADPIQDSRTIKPETNNKYNSKPTI